ncbi:phage tail protein [Sandarakinorhabdus sp. AAP62]|uniref:phage tail protein n=1 Tax=Sandarakinorhabdus sp. AAP62 TaxID=1248916 RepID=UPI0003059D64|nr:phage tail protein [Sandarakinorhabdus sp. AAP62]
MSSTQYSPPPAFAFSVGISTSASSVFADSIDASFQELSGVDSKVDIQVETEAGLNAYVHKLPGVTRHANLVLKRGLVTQKSALADWAAQSVGSTYGSPIKTQTIIVVLFDSHGKAQLAWTFLNAYAVKWDVGPFDPGNSGKILTESLEICYSTASRALIPGST